MGLTVILSLAKQLGLAIFYARLHVKWSCQAQNIHSPEILQLSNLLKLWPWKKDIPNCPTREAICSVSENMNCDHDREVLVGPRSSRLATTSLSTDQRRSCLAAKWNSPGEEAFLVLPYVFFVMCLFLGT